jgi:hypothetical protein
VDFYDRLATYEGLEFDSQPESLAVPQIVADIQRICAAVVEHIRVVSGGNVAVTRLVLYLKQDVNDRLWLLYCGGVQIYDPESEKSRGPDVELILSLPEEARSKVLIAGNNYFELQANRKPCLACNLLVVRLYPVQYSLLEECWQRHLPDPPSFKPSQQDPASLDVSQEQASDQVPVLVKRAMPGITNERYEALKSSTKWLHSRVNICEDCYLHYTGLVINGKSKPKTPTIKSRRTLSMAKLEEILATESKKPVERTKRRILPASQYSSPHSSMPPSRGFTASTTSKIPQLVPKLHGHFTAKRLPFISSIYSAETGASSRRSSTHKPPLSALSASEQAEVLKDTIRSLKLCLLDGV